MAADPPLLSVPVTGIITVDQFLTYLDAVGLPPYEQWTVAEYDTSEADTRSLRLVNLRDGMSAVLTFTLDTAGEQWRRTS